MSTIPGLYRLFRNWGNSRPRAALDAVRMAWAAHLYDRELRRAHPREEKP